MIRVAMLALVLACACTASCTPLRRSVARPDEVRYGEALLVGRVELVPPLGPHEQELSGQGPIYDHRNTAYVLLGNRLTSLGESHDANLSGSIPQRLGESFRVPVEAGPWFVRGIGIVLRSNPATDVAYLMRPFRIDVRPGDRAIYVGTLRFVRNEFFDLVRVEVIDDYDVESAAFAGRFAKLGPMTKRLAEPLPDPAAPRP